MKTNSGEGQPDPSPDPFPSGEGDTPPNTPSALPPPFCFQKSTAQGSVSTPLRRDGTFNDQ